MSKTIDEMIEDGAEYIIIDGMKYKIISHADGVNFVPVCDFCVDPCYTDWCAAKEEE